MAEPIDDIFDSFARELLGDSYDARAIAAPQPQPAAAEAPAAVSGATPPLARESISDRDEIARYEDDARELETDPEHFDRIKPTTFGLSGSLSGVSFNESELIKHIAPFLRYPCLRAVCNDGAVSVADFDDVIARYGIDLSTNKRNERSRAKKRERTRAKPRKVRGTGTSFDSSILFWIHSAEFGSIYKIRLFRNGHFGLPGTKPEMIRDIIRIRDTIFIPLIAQILQAAGHLPAPPDVRSQGLVPIMKNYKWRRFMPPGTILNLELITERVRSRANETRAMHDVPFRVHYARYIPGESTLSVSFATPTESRASKSIRVNIFQSGKINILGAHVSSITKKICEYLAQVINDEAIVHPFDGDSDNTEDSDDARDDEEFARELRELTSDEWLTRALDSYFAKPLQ